MNVRYQTYLLIRLCVVTTLLFAWTEVFAQSNILTVSPNGSISTLETAIQKADSGDVIHLKPGTYSANEIAIDKSIQLIGEKGVILDIGNEGFGLLIQGNNIALQNFEIKNSGSGFMEDYAAILIEDSHNVTVQNVKLTNNFFGVYIAKSDSILISDNHIVSNAERQTKSGNGIHLWYSKNVQVHNNYISGHRDGIYLEFVESSLMTKNESEKNIRYGLHFMYSDQCVYNDNIFRNNLTGVAVMYSKNVVMKQNQFVQNWGANRYGLLLKEINDSEVSNNRFQKNTVGIYSEASNRVEIHQNEFMENGTALRMMANGVDNNITKNNFINNTFEVTTNSRQNPNHYNHNYWGQYEGYDLNRDGIGDVPYRPVRFFSILAEKQPIALVMLRSMLVDLLDTVERIIPVMTPKNLTDEEPLMRPVR